VETIPQVIKLPWQGPELFFIFFFQKMEALEIRSSFLFYVCVSDQRMWEEECKWKPNFWHPKAVQWSQVQRL